MNKTLILKYLREAEGVFKEWTGEVPDVNSNARDREPISAIAAMLQVEENL